MQVIVSRAQPSASGNLLLMRESDRRMEEGAAALVLGVGGDTLISLATLLDNHKFNRPMALDLLWQVSFSPCFVLSVSITCMMGTSQDSKQAIC